MSQRLYFDFNDGYGERDYTKFLAEADQFTTHELNKPALFSFNVTPVGDLTNWRQPDRGVFVRFEDDAWLSRVPGARDNVIFSGYLSADPDLVQLGNQGLWAYMCQATSEEYLANLKALPRVTYINTTRGFIIRDLLRRMFATSPNLPYSLDNINDGGRERIFQVDPTKKFSDLVAEFAKADNYRYYIIDSCFVYAPQDEFLPNAHNPRNRLYIDISDPRYTPENLKLTHVAGSTYNDVTVIGNDEPTTSVRERFVSDGYSAAFQLAFTPFGTVENSLLKEDFTGDSIDDSLWNEVDVDGQDYIQEFQGSLNVIGGPGGATEGVSSAFIRSKKGVELSGVMHFRDGEIFFAPGSTGKGIIGGLYTAADDTLSEKDLVCGWKIDLDAGKLYPFSPDGVEIAAGIPINQDFHYVLRKQLTVDKPVRNQVTYVSQADGYRRSFEADSGLTGDCNIHWSVDQIDPTDPDNVVTTTIAVLDKSFTGLSDFALYVPIASYDLHIVQNYVEIFKPQQCEVRITPPGGTVSAPIRIGNALDGGRAAITTDGAPRLAWYALPLPSQNSRAATTPADAVTIPPQGSLVEILYWRKEKARGRLISQEAINRERVRYHDDGVRQTTIQAGDYKPIPNTTEECLALAQAFLADRVNPRYEGSYGIEPCEGAPTELNYWIFPGDLVPAYIEQPDYLTVDQRLLVASVKTSFLGKGCYSVTLTFGALDRVTEVIRQLVLKRASSLDDPSIEKIEAVDTSVFDDTIVPADPTNWKIIGVTATDFTVAMTDWSTDSPTDLPEGVAGYEVRRDDTGWGQPNYVARFNTPTETFTRNKRDLSYYIRPFSAAGVYSRRSAFVRVVHPLVNTTVPTGLYGYVSATTPITVVVPLPNNPDIAGILVRGADPQQTLFYQGDGVDTIAQYTEYGGVNAIPGTSQITVQIPNPFGVTLSGVWVWFYDLLGNLGSPAKLIIDTPPPSYNSVGLALPTNEFHVSNTPVSSNGTLSVVWQDQAAGLVFASPRDHSGQPSFRALTAEDIPQLDFSKITTGGFLPTAPVYSVLQGTPSSPPGYAWSQTPRTVRQGIGADAYSDVALRVAGTYGSDMYVDGNSGSSKTVDLSTGNEHRVTLNNDCTLSFSNPRSGFRYVLILRQDATGNRTPTFPASFLWQHNITPEWSTSSNGWDVITFMYDGTASKYYAVALIGDAYPPNIYNPVTPVVDKTALRFDGTSGKLIKNSTLVIQDDGRLSSVTDPTSAQDAATKNYVDTTAVALRKRGRVRVATTANITIASALNNGSTLDGVTLVTGDLVLVKDQSTQSQNGIYVVSASPARDTEFDTYNKHPGQLVTVQEGTANADTLWLCTSDVGGTLNTTAIVFAQFTGGGGSTMSILTADPGSPSNDTAWVFRDGGSPQNVSLRVRISGTTYDIPLFQLP